MANFGQLAAWAGTGWTGVSHAVAYNQADKKFLASGPATRKLLRDVTRKSLISEANECCLEGVFERPNLSENRLPDLEVVELMG
ncbi:MAG: hypothetical protein BZY75_06695 [SAR202 cluster bacterium Io17-Chloro-G7]|nr:MAG: hypothetical protein BZY75_06695 [SAR202 cluster bacterium Io17-Chloro-G7]